MINLLGFMVLILCGLGFGVLAAAGVFTVLIAVGLIPRFAWKTHTGNRIFLYEEAALWGAILGGIVSLFIPKLCVLRKRISGGCLPINNEVPNNMYLILLGLFLVVVGLFFGIFVGCLAIAIAEMLDGIPIMIRRYTSLHHRHIPTFIVERRIMGPVLIAVSFGKCVGSLIYFSLLLWKG